MDNNNIQDAPNQLGSSPSGGSWLDDMLDGKVEPGTVDSTTGSSGKDKGIANDQKNEQTTGFMKQFANQ